MNFRRNLIGSYFQDNIVWRVRRRIRLMAAAVKLLLIFFLKKMQLIALQWTRMISVNKNNPAIKVIYPVDSVISLSKNSGQEKHQRGRVTVF